MNDPERDPWPSAPEKTPEQLFRRNYKYFARHGQAQVFLDAHRHIPQFAALVAEIEEGESQTTFPQLRKQA